LSADNGGVRRASCAWLACALAASCARPPLEVQYDLAQAAAHAELALPGEVRVILGPPVHVRPGLGFLRQRGEDDEARAARHERTAFVSWRRRAPRVAVMDVEAREAGEAVVHLNESEVARLALTPGRRRYRAALPEAAQTRRENRVRVVLPAEGALHSVRVAASSDPALGALEASGVAPLEVTRTGAVPSLTQHGPGTLRVALRLPEAAELRFTPEPAEDAVGLRILLETLTEGERGIWSGTPLARGSEVVLRLPGEAGTLARLSLQVESGRAVWRAPRVLGRGAGDGLAAPPWSDTDQRRAAPLRRALAAANVVLVVLDAASARHFQCYGYGRATTPEIDRLAAEGVLFEQAYTPAVYTLSAMASLWTSLHHDQHHAGVRHSDALPGGPRTLAERLRARGVHTAGFVSNPSAGKPFGLQRGFAEFHELYRSGGRFVGVPRAEDFRPLLRSFLDGRRASGRFLLYVHFLEPHFPYDPQPPFQTRFGPDSPLPQSAKRSQEWIRAVNAGTLTPSTAEREHLVRLYDGNLAAADHELGRLREALEATGLLERSVVVVTADHGEALGEHGFIGHAPQLFEEALQIPLIVRLPRGAGPAGLRVPGLVDLLDLAPTLLEVFGVDADGPPAEGRSLLPMLAGAAGKPALIARTMAERPAYSLREGRYKLIHSLRDGSSRLFDLSADPLEARDLSDGEGLRVEFYRQALYRWLASRPRAAAGPSAPETTLSPEERDALRALGYVQ
jgi:arylsulfatase A-like enzyme